MPSFGDEKIIHSSQQHELGSTLELPDGRKFVYCLNDATVDIAGNIYQSPTISANFRGLSIVNPTAVDSNIIVVSLGSTALTAGQLIGGWVNVRATGGAGGGRLYKIKSNPVAATSTNVVITLAELVREAWTIGTTLVDLIPNLWSSVELLSFSEEVPLVVGVAVADVPARQYGWYQTHGLCSVLSPEIALLGRSLSTSTANQFGLTVLEIS